MHETGNARQEFERLAVRFLDSAGKSLAEAAFSNGSPTGVAPPLKRIVGEAIALDAAAVTVSHNHPSGVAKPSAVDHAFTKKLVNALHPLGIRLHDHVITTAGERYSFRAEGLL